MTTPPPPVERAQRVETVEPVETLTEVAPGVHVVTHPFCTTTTTVVVGDDGRDCLVVDPAVTAAEIDALASELARRGLRVTAGFSTHPHWDHLLWRPALGDVPRWATAEGASRARASTADNARKADAALAGVDTGWMGTVVALSPTASTLPWPGRTVRLLQHRAHAPGHGALLVDDVGVLVAGDMLSDVETPLLDLDAEDPVGDYRAALDLFSDLVAEVSVLVPGHGSVTDADGLVRRIAADRAYLDALTATDAPTSDPRLAGAEPWLVAEHEAAVRRLSPRARRGDRAPQPPP